MRSGYPCHGSLEHVATSSRVRSDSGEACWSWNVCFWLTRRIVTVWPSLGWACSLLSVAERTVSKRPFACWANHLCSARLTRQPSRARRRQLGVRYPARRSGPSLRACPVLGCPLLRLRAADRWPRYPARRSVPSLRAFPVFARLLLRLRATHLTQPPRPMLFVGARRRPRYSLVSYFLRGPVDVFSAISRRIH